MRRAGPVAICTRLRGPVVAHLMRCFTDDWSILRASGSKGFWANRPQRLMSRTSWARGIEAGPDEALDRTLDLGA